MKTSRRLCKPPFVICILLVTTWFSSYSMGLAAEVSLLLEPDCSRSKFAADNIESALRGQGHTTARAPIAEGMKTTVGPRIVLGLLPNDQVTQQLRQADAKDVVPEREGFSIRVTRSSGATTFWVLGTDSAGLMYGGLDLAEVIRVAGIEGIKNDDQKPYMSMRGTKFNIPLDVRTPSYTDVCDAAQKNIGEMWNMDFWTAYIDQLALHRYNFVSLWSLHPFPSLVKVPEYPDVALEDVRRSTTEWKETYSLNGTGFDSPEILGQTETLKEMTIDDKIAFWRAVMQYGKDRNVEFYVVTWNIFNNGTDGKYGITDDINNEITTDYFRKSVKQMFLTYPHLAGIGLTTGENMHGSNFEQKEEWAFNTYAQGVLDAVKELPGRKIRFIHRQHMTGAKDIARRFAPLIDHDDVDFIFSFKYAKAHVYSSTRQTFHPRFVKDIGDLKTIWTLRNDDVYFFRWGSPDFVRTFIKNIPYRVSQGFYFGSDQYVWGREFLSTEPETPREIELAKHWYHWMIWGRLGYNPDLSDERFVQVIQQKWPSISGTELFVAWQEASMIYPTTTGFHWGSLDFQWYIEACKSQPGPAKTTSGFHDVNRFISLGPHPGTDNVSIPDYVKRVTSGEDVGGTSPLEVADRLHAHADKALKSIATLNHGGDKQLRLTLGDIRAMALLGKYYGHKIRGATELELYRAKQGDSHQEAAVDELNQAAESWRRYASVALTQYTNPLWTNRVGYCDWRRLFEYVLEDVRIAGGDVELRSMEPTAGGMVLEAESARTEGGQVAQDVTGFTGDGYLQFKGKDDGWLEWTVEIPDDCIYSLELRYAKAKGLQPTAVSVDGTSVGEIMLWSTGGDATWGWDRLSCKLDPGKHTIRIAPPSGVRIDHLNLVR